MGNSYLVLFLSIFSDASPASIQCARRVVTNRVQKLNHVEPAWVCLAVSCVVHEGNILVLVRTNFSLVEHGIPDILGIRIDDMCV